MQQKWQKIKTNFFFFLELQLVISITILPMLIWWGLPISLMSIVGNLIFTQVLTIFIALSAILFFTNFTGIPNYWIIQMLELVTACWYYILSFAQQTWLYAIPLWLFPISIGCAIAAYLMYTHTKIIQTTRIIILFFLTLLPLNLHIALNSFPCHTTIFHGSAPLYLLKIQGKTYAFDYGALEARPHNATWIEYELLPTLVQKIGSIHIDTLVVCKPNARTEQAISDLCSFMPTMHITYLEKPKNLIFQNNFFTRNFSAYH